MRDTNLILCFIMCMTITHISISQENCKIPTAEKIMNVNRVSAKILNNGKLFNKGNYLTPYSPDSEKNVNAIYNSGLWIGGKNNDGNPIFSGVWFDILSNTDYFSGPISSDTLMQHENCTDWDKIFSVDGPNLLDFIKYYQNQVKSGQPIDCQRIPEDILLWPAKGNPYFKQHFGWSLPDQDLAGFWDLDKDGIYDPCKGDYPYINDKCENAPGYHSGEKIPAEINYFVFNDAAGTQTFSQGGFLKMEVHVHAYAYNDNPDLEDATFYHYKLINKSNEYFTDFYMSYWANSDLGCPFDDAIGCDTIRGMAYIYNLDSLDASSILCDNIGQYSVNSYGENVPIVGFDFVKGPKGGKVFRRSPSGQIMYDTHGKPILENPESICQSVDTLIQLQMSSFNYFLDCNLISHAQPFCFPGWRRDLRDQFLYNVLQGLWSDGAPMTYGELGYQGTEVTKFAFPGEPSDTSAWSRCQKDWSSYLNPSFVMSMGPICFAPDEIHEMTLAVFSVHGVQLPCPILDEVKASNDAIQGLFDNCDMIVSTIDNITETQELKIFPNPKDKFQEITVEGLYDKSTIEIFDVMGRSVYRTVTQEKSINISNANLHSSGIYWVKLTDYYTGKHKTMALVVL